MGTPPGGQPLIYLQIARMLEDDILRGVYQEEEQVPSTNELARAYRINPATAAKGINLLVTSGVLYKGYRDVRGPRGRGGRQGPATRRLL